MSRRACALVRGAVGSGWRLPDAPAPYREGIVFQCTSVGVAGTAGIIYYRRNNRRSFGLMPALRSQHGDA